MNRRCENNGGPASIIRLAQVPQLDQEALVAEESLAALEAWEARPGEVLTIADPENRFYKARLLSRAPESAVCLPFSIYPSPVESPLQIQIFHALPEKERFELVLEKLTELGVTRIVPMVTECSVTREERDSQQKKSHRWPHLLRRASRQCRRAMLPELYEPLDFVEALEFCSEAELKLLLYEGEAPWTLTDGIGDLKPASVAVMVGPEGGFTEEEVTMAQNAGVLPVHLGPRVMRTETAAIVAATLVQGLLGDLR